MSENPIRPTADTFTSRVEAGVALLDEQHPEWWEEINLDILNVGSGTSCVTAQMYRIYDNSESDPCGRWMHGAKMLGLNTDDESDDKGNYVVPSEYILHGFNAEGSGFTENYTEGEWTFRPGWEDYDYNDSINTLNNLWRNEITSRREKAAASL